MWINTSFSPALLALSGPNKYFSLFTLIPILPRNSREKFDALVLLAKIMWRYGHSSYHDETVLRADSCLHIDHMTHVEWWNIPNEGADILNKHSFFLISRIGLTIVHALVCSKRDFMNNTLSSMNSAIGKKDHVCKTNWPRVRRGFCAKRQTSSSLKKSRRGKIHMRLGMCSHQGRGKVRNGSLSLPFFEVRALNLLECHVQ